MRTRVAKRAPDRVNPILGHGTPSDQGATVVDQRTPGGDVRRRQMDRRQLIQIQQRRQFPSIEVNQTPKYNKMFTRLSERISFFKKLLLMYWIV